MKKFLLFLFLFIPFFVKAESKVYIESIELEENNDVEIVSSPRIEDMKVNLNLKFTYYDSSITYKLKIKNKTNEDYKLDDNIDYLSGDYIKYSFICDVENNVIPSYKDTTCLLTATYYEPVTFTKLKAENGSVISTDNVVMSLSPQEINNPKTGNMNLVGLLIIYGIIAFMIFSYSNKKQFIKLGSVILFLFILIPISINAMETIKLDVTSKVEIIGNTKKCSHNPRDTREFIMCEMESSFVPILIESIEQEKENYSMAELEANYNSTKEDIKNELHEAYLNGYITESEYNGLLSSYLKELDFHYSLFTDTVNAVKKYSEEIIDNLDWDSYSSNSPTESNYGAYPDGIYLNGIRLVPIFSEDTVDELNEYLDKSELEKPNFVFSANTIKDLSGYSFGKIKGGARIINIEDYPIISVADVSSDSIEVNINGSIDTTIPEIFSPNENVNLTSYLSFIASTETDDQTGNTIVHIGDLTLDSDFIYYQLFDNNYDFFNDLMHLYTSVLQTKGSQYISDTNINIERFYDTIAFKYFIETAKNYDVIEEDWDDVVSGNISQKVQDYIRWFNIEIPPQIDAWIDEYLENLSNDESMSDLYSRIDEYYSEHPYQTSEMKIVYDGNFYTGKDGLLHFIVDYFDFEIQDDDNFEVQLIAKLKEKRKE